MNGVISLLERIVSLHNSDARPIRKGKLKEPNECSRTLQLVQDSSLLVIVEHELNHGNPSDRVELVPLVKKFKKRFRRSPDKIVTDKRYYSEENIGKLQSMNIR